MAVRLDWIFRMKTFKMTSIEEGPARGGDRALAGKGTELRFSPASSKGRRQERPFPFSSEMRMWIPSPTRNGKRFSAPARRISLTRLSMASGIIEGAAGPPLEKPREEWLPARWRRKFLEKRELRLPAILWNSGGFGRKKLTVKKSKETPCVVR